MNVFRSNVFFIFRRKCRERKELNNLDIMKKKMATGALTLLLFVGMSGCKSTEADKTFVDLFSRVGSGEIASYETLAADRLVEAYAKDELKGQLKEIAAGLDEESNPVLMLMKYRK